MSDGIRRAIAGAMQRFDLGHYHDLLVAADPGRTQLRRAARAAGTAAVAALVLSRAANALHQSATITFVGVVIATLGNVLVSGEDPPRARTTMILTVPLACTMLTIATLASRTRELGIGLFLVVIFCAVLGRRYGPRGQGLGMMAFLSYFFALFFRVSPEAIPWMAAAVTLATGLAILVRFVIVPDRPAVILAETVRAFRARTAVALYDVERFVLMPGDERRGRRSQHRIQASLARLADVALALDDQVGAFAPDRPPSPDTRAWASRVASTQYAVETLADDGRYLHSAAAPPEVRGRYGELLDTLRRAVSLGATPLDRAKLEERLAAPVHLSAPPLGIECQVATAVDRLARDAPWAGRLPAPAGTAPGRFEPGNVAVAMGTPDGKGAGNAPSSLQTAVQATLAGGLSVAVGYAISPARWYWAAIAAFVVFVRATTFGEAVVRAWQRAAGTAAGVAGGLVVAELVGNDRRLQLALLFAGLFGAYLLIRNAYHWAVGCLTVSVAMLYRVLGQYEPGVLVLRLEETLAGTIVAALVTRFVFRARTSTKVRELEAAILRRASTAVAEATDEAVARDRYRVLGAARQLDRALQALWQFTLPLTGSDAPLRFARLLLGKLEVTELTHCVHHLALPDDTVREPSPASTLIAEIGRRLATNCQSAADALEGARAAAIASVMDLVTTLASRIATPPELERCTTAEWLGRIDRLVDAVVTAWAPGTPTTDISRSR